MEISEPGGPPAAFRGEPGSASRKVESIADARGETLDERRDDLPDHAAALDALMSRLRDRGLDRDDLLAAVGHRIVHGGGRHRGPQRVTPGGVAGLRAFVPIEP